MNKLKLMFCLLALCMCSLRAQVGYLAPGVIDTGDGELDLWAFESARFGVIQDATPVRVMGDFLEKIHLFFIHTPLVDLSDMTLRSKDMLNQEASMGGAFLYVPNPYINYIGLPDNEGVFVPFLSSDQDNTILFSNFHFPTTLTDLCTGGVLDSDIENIVILVHGWNPKSVRDHYLSSFRPLTNNLKEVLTGTGWGLVQYHWEADAATGDAFPPKVGPSSLFSAPIEAASVGDSHGRYLTFHLLSQYQNLKRVTLMCHSAGSWIGYRATKYLLDLNPSIEVELMLMDPFIPGIVEPNLSPLSVGRMSTLDQFGDRVRLHNYSSGDGIRTLAACRTGDSITYGTHPVFSWFGEQHIQRQLHMASWNTTFEDPCIYGGHAGPIQFVADTVGRFIDKTSSNWAREWNYKYGFEKSLFAEYIGHKNTEQVIEKAYGKEVVVTEWVPPAWAGSTWLTRQIADTVLFRGDYRFRINDKGSSYDMYLDTDLYGRITLERAVELGLAEPYFAELVWGIWVPRLVTTGQLQYGKAYRVNLTDLGRHQNPKLIIGVNITSITKEEIDVELDRHVTELVSGGGEVYGSNLHINGKVYDLFPQTSYNTMRMCIPDHKGFETWHEGAGLNLTENEFTIEGWWQPLGIPGHTTFMEKLKRTSNNTNVGWCYELVHGTDLCFWYQAVGQSMTMFVSPNAVSPCDANTPMHLYLSVNQADQTAVMYKNGEPLSVERRYAGSSEIQCDASVPFRFGASAAYSWREFHGTVRDWHIWKGQKSIEWIKAQEWFPGWYGDCIASWSFCKRDLDNGWIDDSFNNNHLTTAGYHAGMSLGDLSLDLWNELRSETWGIDPCTLPPVTFDDGMIYHYPGILTVGYDIGNTVSDIETLPIFNTREFTLSLWAQVPAIGEQAIFSAQEYGTEGSNIVLGVSGAGEICGSFLWGGYRANSGLCPRYGALADGNWKHIVYRYYEVDGYPVSDIHVNGVLIGSMHRPTFAPYEPRNSRYYILLGGRVDVGHKVRAFGGSLANVRVYPSKKDEAAIASLYTSGF